MEINVNTSSHIKQTTLFIIAEYRLMQTSFANGISEDICSGGDDDKWLSSSGSQAEQIKGQEITVRCSVLSRVYFLSC
jgi:hypothetical protein